MYYDTYLVTFLKSFKKRKDAHISYINNYYSRVGMIT